MKRSKVLSITLLCLCLAALIGLSVIAHLSSAKVDQLMSAGIDGANDTLPGTSWIFVLITYFGLIFIFFVESFIVALCGWIAAIAGIKFAANRIYKGIFIALTVYFSLVLLVTAGVILVVILH